MVWRSLPVSLPHWVATAVFSDAGDSSPEDFATWPLRRELVMGEVFEPVLPAVWGSEDRQMGRSGRRGVVLVDETAEHVVAPDLAARDQGAGRAGGHFELDASVRTLLVIVPGVLTQDPLEMPLAGDGQLIEALGPYPSLPTVPPQNSPAASGREF